MPGWSTGCSAVSMTCAMDGVVENKRCKILWDMTIQCDHVIEARRPDIVVVEKESNKAIIVDLASPLDHRVY